MHSDDLHRVERKVDRLQRGQDRLLEGQDHQHKLLHTLIETVATLARGGMTDEEEAALAVRLSEIAQRLYAITESPETERGTEMAIPQSVTDALQQVDDATNQVATVVTSLRDQIKVGMTQQDVDDVKSRLTTVADHLKAIAADPDNPVPPAPPQLAQAFPRQAGQSSKKP